MRTVVAMFVRCCACRHLHKRTEIEWRYGNAYCTTPCCTLTPEQAVAFQEWLGELQEGKVAWL